MMLILKRISNLALQNANNSGKIRTPRNQQYRRTELPIPFGKSTLQELQDRRFSAVTVCSGMPNTQSSFEANPHVAKDTGVR